MIPSFDNDGADVVYEETELRLEKALIEEAIGKSCPDMTDREVPKTVGKRPALSGESRHIRDILNSS